MEPFTIATRHALLQLTSQLPTASLKSNDAVHNPIRPQPPHFQTIHRLVFRKRSTTTYPQPRARARLSTSPSPSNQSHPTAHQTAVPSPRWPRLPFAATFRPSTWSPCHRARVPAQRRHRVSFPTNGELSPGREPHDSGLARTIPTVARKRPPRSPGAFARSRTRTPSDLCCSAHRCHGTPAAARSQCAQRIEPTPISQRRWVLLSRRTKPSFWARNKASDPARDSSAPVRPMPSRRGRTLRAPPGGGVDPVMSSSRRSCPRLSSFGKTHTTCRALAFYPNRRHVRAQRTDRPSPIDGRRPLPVAKDRFVVTAHPFRHEADTGHRPGPQGSLRPPERLASPRAPHQLER